MESSEDVLVDVIYNGVDVDPGGGDRVSVPKGVRFRAIGPVRLLAYLVSPHLAIRIFSRSGLPRLVGCIQDADVIIVAPSGANLGIYRDWVYLLRLLIVVRAGGRPVFHFSSIGPSGSRVFDYLAHAVLRRSKVYVRESRCQEYLLACGMPSTLGPDTAFALAPVAGDVRGNVISVVPAELASWHPHFAGAGIEDAIMGEIAPALARFCLEKDLMVEILPHLRTETERVFNLKFAASLAAHGLGDGGIRLPDVCNFREYDRLLGTSRLVVGGRYHAIVLAAKNCRPFVSLGYESKMSEVCDYLGLPEMNLSLLENRDDLGPHFSRCLRRAYQDEEAISAHLAAVVEEVLRGSVRRVLEDLSLLGDEPLLDAD